MTSSGGLSILPDVFGETNRLAVVLDDPASGSCGETAWDRVI